MDIGGILAAIPLLLLWLSIQRCSGNVVGEEMPRYPDPTPLQPPLSLQEKIALGSGTRKVISAQKEDKACRQPQEDKIWGRGKDGLRDEPAGS